jgi:hypothetical protein
MNVNSSVAGVDMAFRTILMLLLLFGWTGTLQGQEPPLLAIHIESRPVSFSHNEMYGEDLTPIFSPRIDPTAPTSAVKSEVSRARRSGPLPATLAVVMAGLLTAAIMQTRR